MLVFGLSMVSAHATTAIPGVPVTLEGIQLFIEDIVTYFMEISGVIIVGVMVYAGIRMASAGGTPAKFEEGKKMLIQAAWGAVVVFGVGTIVKTIAGFAHDPTQIVR